MEKGYGLYAVGGSSEEPTESDPALWDTRVRDEGETSMSLGKDEWECFDN